ncbi:TauD/TfdA family dioxygenase [Ideonella sp. A 288]|uniref:TauD/TfdA family dioxygenase n=1 Tax=Ideonella sp. A 288 TaxID=1962181 RepID=UPI000B4B69F8|nr:TauD/TfdA family dioxygenase [Ideonella sp. A 288]
MNAPLRSTTLARQASPFDLDDEASYRRWRDAKLAARPAGIDDLLVDIADPLALTVAEREALLQRLSRANMALYRGPARACDRDVVTGLGRQLGLCQLDGHWLAEEDGVSRIAVSAQSDGRGGYIPYTDNPIRWHTDGYYQGTERRIRGMVLHCVRPACEGGVNGLMDHELAYIALRDASPDHVRALMAPDAMTIPERRDDDGVARAATTGPVFSVDTADGALHMRYTARTRSIQWKDDAATRAAVDCLQAILSSESPQVLHVRMEAGMGLVSHNVLHDRSAFHDDSRQPRLLYRARYLDRSAAPELPWR